MLPKAPCAKSRGWPSPDSLASQSTDPGTLPRACLVELAPALGSHQVQVPLLATSVAMYCAKKKLLPQTGAARNPELPQRPELEASCCPAYFWSCNRAGKAGKPTFPQASSCAVAAALLQAAPEQVACHPSLTPERRKTAVPPRHRQRQCRRNGR